MTLTFIKRGALAGAAVLAAGLGGCATDYYGGGVATGYYAGPVGYGYDYYAGYGYPAYGWFGDFYYPGYGTVVFDRYGHRRGWSDAERAHWQPRGEWRENHLYQGGRFDARRDHAYMSDRDAAFRGFRGGGDRPGGGRPGGERQGGGHHDGGHDHH